MPAALLLRPMQASDLPFADSVRQLAGWNQTDRDWLRLMRHEPGGCLIAEWRGARAGTVTTTAYGCDLAWIGMLLVHPDHRGKGIGSALLKAAIDYLRSQQVRCIKLDATPQGQPIYERLGFKAEWSLQRWEVHKPNLPDRPLRFKTRLKAASDNTAIATLDKEAFGADRRQMLTMIGEDGDWVVNESPKRRVNGFGLLRKGSRAVYLGPVVAEHLPAASAVLKSVLEQLPDRRFFWDIPDHQPGAVELARSFGFHPQRILTRMYLGENVPGNPDMIYALAAPEIG